MNFIYILQNSWFMFVPIPLSRHTYTYTYGMDSSNSHPHPTFPLVKVYSSRLSHWEGHSTH